MDGLVTLAARFASVHSAQAARRLETVDPASAASLLEVLPSETSAAVMSLMVPAIAADVMMRMEAPARSGMMAAIPVAGRVAILRHVAGHDLEAVLDGLPGATVDHIRRVLRHAVGTVATIMDSSIAPLPADMSVEDAQRVAPDPRLPYAYVVDRDQRLVGVVHRRDLAAAASVEVAKAMTGDVVRVPASAPINAIVNHRAWRDYEALPVVDADGVYLGAIRHKRLRRGIRPPSQTAVPRAAIDTVLDLGELYWSGLWVVVDVLAKPPATPEGGSDG